MEHLDLDSIILAVTAANDVIYFQLPVDVGYMVLRECVYCYELYYQMRSI